MLVRPLPLVVALLQLLSALSLGVSATPSREDAAAKVARNGTVIVTAANFGYLNHVQNFKCFMDRLGLNFLLVALDERAFEGAQRLGVVSVSLTTAGRNASRRVRGTDAQRTQQIRSSPQSALVVEEAAADYHTHGFHVITVRKIEAVVRVLQLGFDVLFIDSDVVLLRDPFPLLGAALAASKADYIFTSNKLCPAAGGLPFDFRNPQEEGNTGLFFVRPSPGILALLNATIAAAPSFPGLDDQSIFWRVARAARDVQVVALPSCASAAAAAAAAASTSPSSLTTALATSSPSSPSSPRATVCALDECGFSVGALRGTAFAALQAELQRRGAEPVSLHANWIKGNAAKAAALAARGLWLSQPGGGGGGGAVCAPLVSPFPPSPPPRPPPPPK